jgi:myosin heavy subunit
MNDTTKVKTNDATPRKRTLDSSIDDLDEYMNMNATKKTILEENIDFVINDADCIETEDIEIIEKPVTKKYNFGKRKAKFSTKEERMRRTAEGREQLLEKNRKHNEQEKLRNEKIRATPEGRKEYNEQQRYLVETIRATPEGRKEYNEQQRYLVETIRATPEGRKEHNEQEKLRNEKIRALSKAILEEQLRNTSFPPEFKDDKIEKECIEKFIKATSLDSLLTRECGICGKAVRHGQFTERLLLDDNKNGIPNLTLLSTEHQGNPNCLREYVREVNLDEGLPTKLLLSPGGVDKDQIVCCNKCLYS